jgi:hypothetical protein
LRSSLGTQPRARNYKPLIPEFKTAELLSVSLAGVLQIEKSLTGKVVKEDLEVRGGTISKGSVVDHLSQVPNDGKWSEGHLELVIEVGKEAWSPQEFETIALTKEHPAFGHDRTLDKVKAAIFRILSWGPNSTRKERKQALEFWAREAVRLAEEEAVLHSSMDPGIARIMKDKKLLLFGKMLEAIKHEDKELIADLVHGFKIAGDGGYSGAFAETESEPCLPMEELLARAEELQRSVTAMIGPSGDKDLDAEVTRKTKMEAEEYGTLRGPFTAEELKKRLGRNWIASQRFGIRQGG